MCRHPNKVSDVLCLSINSAVVSFGLGRLTDLFRPEETIIYYKLECVRLLVHLTTTLKSMQDNIAKKINK
jgi:hypothetical protein